MIKNPALIERKSFEIISSELEYEIIKENEPTIIRIIHTTADFEYAKITEIHEGAIQRGKKAIEKGCGIYADTNMICAGINKGKLKEFNSEVYSLVSDNAVKEEARERGVTRSVVGMEKACKDTNTKVFVIGNAPTALFTLKEIIDSGRVKPELVVAVPVGFVGAEESKEEIKKAGVPYIVTNGRKGGSTVAVAIVNSLLYQI
ncbi:MAG: precorrin-8X methylmutase [bacterium]|nr:precorrin-8X methylmutase [bacterium]